jgi:hypothetical protein
VQTVNIIHDRMLVTMYLPCINKLTNNQIFMRRVRNLDRRTEKEGGAWGLYVKFDLSSIIHPQVSC